MKRTTGRYESSSVAGETVQAFVPEALPPAPPLEFGLSEQELLEVAGRNLGKLDGTATVLNVPWLTYMYVRKEAVLSSQIEGTQSSLTNLLLHESDQQPGVALDDVEEVVAYVAAMDHGLKRIRSGFPISNRLIREMHRILLTTGRGSGKQPGEFRRSQNWIGGVRPGNAHFVPPPPGRVDDCMSDLERFIHDEPQRTPPLLKSALTHLQFETIHPFLDGNGRIGRLLITLILYDEGALPEPILYLSLYFKQNRQEYYELLDGVRSEGDWESWVRFFLQGVSETSAQANQAARRIRDLLEEDEERIIQLDRIAGSAIQIHRVLKRRPILSIGEASEASGLSFQTALDMLEQLVSMDIAEEITGRQRGRRYAYREYLSILEEGTEPL